MNGIIFNKIISKYNWKEIITIAEHKKSYLHFMDVIDRKGFEFGKQRRRVGIKMCIGT
jgi:hypothetical protein